MRARCSLATSLPSSLHAQSLCSPRTSFRVGKGSHSKTRSESLTSRTWGVGTPEALACLRSLASLLILSFLSLLSSSGCL